MEEAEGVKSSVEVEAKKDDTPERKQSFWHINRKMLPFKVHFFLFIGGMGAILPFMIPLGIIKLGFTARNVVAVIVTQQCILIITKPCISYLADYFNRLKAIIVGLTVLQAAFCLLIIIIPSTGEMPKDHVSQPNASLNNDYKCELCHPTEELANITFNQPVSDEMLLKVLKCFNDTVNFEGGHYRVQCPNENLSSFHSQNISYQIIQTTCDGLLKHCLSSTDCPIPQIQYSANVLIVLQYFDSLQGFLVACFPPKGIKPVQGSFSNFTKYCHAILKPKSMYFDRLFLAIPLDKTKCMNFKSNVSASMHIGHDTDLTAANFRTYQFWWFFLSYLAFCICTSSIYTVSDAACYESMQGANYGRQRAWGSLSWGLSTLLAGFLNEYTEGYFASWCVMTSLCFLQFLNMSKMNLIKPNFSKNILKDIKSVFSSLEFLAFIVGVFINGMLTGTIWVYLPLFLTTIGGNELHIGMTFTAQCFLGEVPLMFVSNWMIKKFGHFNLVSLALITHAMRFFLYSYIYNPFWVFPVEILHGFTFATFYSALTSYGKLISKPGTETTTQSVLNVTYLNLGSGFGCVISGICLDHYGVHTTFFYASFLSVAATLMNVVINALISWRKRNLNVNKMDNANRICNELEMNATAEEQLFIEKL